MSVITAKPEAKTKAKPEAKTKAKPEAKTKAKPEAKPEAKTKTKTKTKANPEAKTKASPEAKPEAKTKAKPEAKVEPKAKAKATATELVPLRSTALTAAAAPVALARLDSTAQAHGQQAAPEDSTADDFELTREAWLMLVLNEALRGLFKRRVGINLPANVRVAIGFPSTGRSSKRVGEVWSSSASADGHFEIFLHPGLETPARALDVFIHELVHVAVGLECGHKGQFKTVATKLGLIGKMTTTTAGPELAKFLEAVLTVLPPYPGAQLKSGTSNTPKKQTTRMLKAVCCCCDYTIRLTRVWAELGLPRCICGGNFVLDE